MSFSKAALLLLGVCALAAVASAQKDAKGAGFWASKGFQKAPKGSIVNDPKPPNQPKMRVAVPPKIKIQVPLQTAIPQQPANPRFFFPDFNKVKGVPAPKPAKVQIIKVKEPKIIDDTEPLKNNEKFPFPDFNKVRGPPTPKPAKVQIIKVKEPKIIDNTEPFKNNEKFPTPDFRKVNGPPTAKVVVITPKVIEEPIKDVTSAPGQKVTKGFMKQDKQNNQNKPNKP